MKHTISILVENQAGVLARIAGLFARRAYNIDSLAVGVTEDVRTVSQNELLSRELVLIKVCCTPAQRAELISIAEISEAKISDISVSTMTLELSDYEGKIRTFEELLRPYGIKEIVRTGTIAIQRGSNSLTI